MDLRMRIRWMKIRAKVCRLRDLRRNQSKEQEVKKFGMLLGSMAVVALVIAGGMSYAGEGACSSKCSSKGAKTAANSQSSCGTTGTATALTGSTTASCDASKASDQKAAGSCDASKCAAGATNAAMTTGSCDASKCAAGANASMKAGTCDASKCSAAGATNAAMTTGSCDASKCAAGANASMKAGTCDASKCSAAGATNAAMTSGSCCASKGANASMASGSSCSTTNAAMTSGSCCASKGANASMASGSCSASKMASGEKGYFGANVYKIDNGVMYAVADGKKFVVSDKTPYNQVGNARFYFADDACAVKCSEKMASMANNYVHEAVELATVESNVKIENGKKIATCSMSGQSFEVNNATPAVVQDGQKTYFCGQGCADHFMGL